MARPLRIQFEGAIVHITARGNRREQTFENDADRERFLGLLEESLRRYEVILHAFVLMPNHFHLLAQTRRANLSRWMHWLMVSYTVYFNRRHRRVGHLFQGRYKSFLVEAGSYLLELSRYLHLNPVRGKALGRGDPAERRSRLRDYRWSSYRGYAGVAAPFRYVEAQLVLSELGAGPRGGALRYRRFVEDGLLREIANPFEAARWQAVLGSESFVQRMRDRLEGQKRSGREMTSLRRAVRGVDPQRIVATVAGEYGVPVERIFEGGGYGLEARNLAIWMVWEVSGLSLREVGEVFGGLDYAAVAQRIRRVKLRHGSSPACRGFLLGGVEVSGRGRV